MSEYTPTTEEIRAAALTDYREEEITPQQFDRWFAEVKAEQDKATTDRIIALLETHHRETQGRGDLAVKYESAVLACIALVKGENK